MKTDPNCIFCKIVVGQISCFKLLEDDDTLAFMDIYPANDGHCLVVAKEHYPNLFEISDQAFAAVSRSVSRIARAVNLAGHVRQAGGESRLEAEAPWEWRPWWKSSAVGAAAGSAIDGMADCAAAEAPLSSPAPSAHRCAAARLDSGTPAAGLAIHAVRRRSGSLEG